jgi:phosphoglycerate dehydrogenase-like enzyme
MIPVTIATPVEPELVERMRAVDPRLEVLYEPELLPPPRFPSDHVGDRTFERTPAQQERFAELVARAEILYGFPREDPAQLAWAVRIAPQLRFVQCMYAGSGQQVANARLTPEELDRISFASSSGVHATPLAEWSLFGILAFAKCLPELQRDQRAKRWAPKFRVDELRGSTVLVVGLGAIGREVARLAEAFGMHVLSVRRTEGDLDELLPRADAVVVTLPLTDETRGLLDARRIARMKRGAIYVNVGRGAVADEAALAAALRDGHLRGAALDVFGEEPLPTDSPFWTLENVIVSPHIAALSAKENERIVDIFVENLRRYLAGEELLSRIDTELFY